jgi:membrane-associated phospholipid phosphatase
LINSISIFAIKLRGKEDRGINAFKPIFVIVGVAYASVFAVRIDRGLTVAQRESALNWNVITNVGDAAIVVPIAAIFGALLWLGKDQRGALVWLSLFGISSFSVVATQAAYAGWGVGIRQFDFTGISGHAMGAASVLPLMGYFIGSRFSHSAGVVAAAFGGLLAMLVALSRVVLGDHSWSEVTSGYAIGAGISVATIAFLRTPPRIFAASIVLAIALLAVVLAAQGTRAPSHRLTVRLALYLSGHTAPFERWRQ